MNILRYPEVLFWGQVVWDSNQGTPQVTNPFPRVDPMNSKNCNDESISPTRTSAGFEDNDGIPSLTPGGTWTRSLEGTHIQISMINYIIS